MAAALFAFARFFGRGGGRGGFPGGPAGFSRGGVPIFFSFGRGGHPFGGGGGFRPFYDDDDEDEDEDEDEDPPWTRYEGSEDLPNQMNACAETWASWEPETPAERALKNAVDKQMDN